MRHEVLARMSTRLSTHILNLDDGRPAEGVAVDVVPIGLGAATRSPVAASGVSDTDGRVRAWSPDVELTPGIWELRFHVGRWFAARGERNFHPEIAIRFEVEPDRPHLHVPLLLNRFGYTTYRGS